ncbi:hypothetical protein [Halodurantibacterium flavum]|uniref:Uncharacterized protein n=1 Tax=Halodurantibacterium flavum TaxID=1382802 RepID=A0ABW4S2T3_9RHOB
MTLHDRRMTRSMNQVAGMAAPLAPNASATPLCAVTLIDRRTGRPHRVNGAALVALARDPDLAAREMLEGRDTTIWEARIQPLPAPALTSAAPL